MSKFTTSDSSPVWKFYDLTQTTARPEVIGMWAMNKAAMRLIEAAPDMYDELYDALQLIKGKSSYEGDEFDVQAKSIRELLNRILGKEII